MDFFDKGDPKGLSTLYTEDCKLMPSGAETQMGRDGEVHKNVQTISFIRWNLSFILLNNVFGSPRKNDNSRLTDILQLLGDIRVKSRGRG